MHRCSVCVRIFVDAKRPECWPVAEVVMLGPLARLCFWGGGPMVNKFQDPDTKKITMAEENFEF